MKKTLLTALFISFMAPSVWAVTTYNQSITAIFGTGNPDTGWTADTANNIQLGLRAKGRNDSSYVGLTPNDGAGTYSFPIFGGARGPFNYEFSINSDASGGGGLNLSFYDFYLAVDGNSSQGVTFTQVDPLAHWGDNSYGNNGTANSAGVEGTAAALAGGNNVAQNSQNITFGDYPGGAFAVPGPADATYNYELFAVADGAGSGGTRLASVGITVVVGNGGAAVPEAGSTLALLGLSLAGLAAFSFRKRKLSA